MKKILTALAATVPLLALGVTFAAPAQANATRIASCSAIGGVYTAGNNASNDRCIVTTSSTAAPVASGTPSTSTIDVNISETYLSLLPVRVDEGEATSSQAIVFGNWAITSLATNTSCVYAGKSKVQKCTATTLATESRDVFTVTTISTPLFDVYEVLQDRQSVTTGTQPTTVTTTTRTVTYRFNSAHQIANVQSDASSDSVAAGDPIAINEEGDVIAVKVGEQLVAAGTDVDILEPVKSGEEVAEPYVVSSVTCVINGSKQTIRDNSCPV